MTRQSEEKTKQQREAEQALNRVQAESDTIGESTFVRMAQRAKNHFAVDDQEEQDVIEIWGKRIGRIAALIFVFFLITHLAVTYL